MYDVHCNETNTEAVAPYALEKFSVEVYIDEQSLLKHIVGRIPKDPVNKINSLGDQRSSGGPNRWLPHA